MITAIEQAVASVAAAALDRARKLAEATPEYQQVIFDLRLEDRREYARAIFEEAGIPEEFVADPLSIAPAALSWQRLTPYANQE